MGNGYIVLIGLPNLWGHNELTSYYRLRQTLRLFLRIDTDEFNNFFFFTLAFTLNTSIHLWMDICNKANWRVMLRVFLLRPLVAINVTTIRTGLLASVLIS